MHVVVHVAVSLDGATTGFEPDLRVFYALAEQFHEDVTLTGADTILAQDLAQAPQPGPNADGPLLLVTDRRSRIDARTLDRLRNAGHWRDARVLTDLGELEGGIVRVDSGGALTGALLQADLVDEVSLLVHPVVAAGGKRWCGDAPARTFELREATALDGGLAWLRLTCVREGSAASPCAGSPGR
ncbi:dihydrofolate reductase family protein [Solirubrobacter sp. CPCC 204708]|uniref:Dihydrofolate reductase family protein n=1 Tax=Solirubrobacter deserti TaxID=2282478 RepID=A0ABT4RKR0_9ACTN|nr:dihydrofolate reductase family protein [Solirubrobacter deserti]MBE2319055.1 dihydrofolate reductase family protein [Solirubrobacter deserti]MDA0139132.1 dihydrofolate reductase family protein [Solirubrobacter deserti]